MKRLVGFMDDKGIAYTLLKTVFNSDKSIMFKVKPAGYISPYIYIRETKIKNWEYLYEK